MFVAEAQSSKCSDISCQSQCIHKHSTHIGSATAAAECAAALAAILDSFGGPVTCNNWNKLAGNALESAHSSAATQHTIRSVHSAPNPSPNGLRLQLDNHLPASISSSGFAQQHTPDATAAADGSDCHASPEANDMGIQPFMHKPVACSLPAALSDLTLSKDAALLTIPPSSAFVPTQNTPHGACSSSFPDDDDTLGLPVFDMPVSRRLPPNLPFWSLDDTPAPPTPTPTPVPSTSTPCTAPSPAATYQALPTAPSRPEEASLPVYDMPLSCRLPPGLPIWSLDNATFPVGAASSRASFTPAASPQHVYAPSHTPADTPAASYSSHSSHYGHFFSDWSQQQSYWQADLPPQLFSQSAPSVNEMQWESQSQQLSLYTADHSIVPVPAEQHAVQPGPLPTDAAEPNTTVLKKKKGTGNTVSVTPC